MIESAIERSPLQHPPALGLEGISLGEVALWRYSSNLQRKMAAELREAVGTGRSCSTNCGKRAFFYIDSEGPEMPTSIPYAIENPATFWAAATAVSTFLAVLVALALPVGGAWISAQRRKKHALQYVDALAAELRWIDEKAEAVIQKARRELGKPEGYVSHGMAIGWSVEDDATRAFDDFAAISFPTYTLAAPALANGPGDLGQIVTSGYGRLYRARAEMDAARGRLAGEAPAPDDLMAYDRAAGSALSAARVTYRLLGAFVTLPIPGHWEPSTGRSAR